MEVAGSGNRDNRSVLLTTKAQDERCFLPNGFYRCIAIEKMA